MLIKGLLLVVFAANFKLCCDLNPTANSSFLSTNNHVFDSSISRIETNWALEFVNAYAAQEITLGSSSIKVFTPLITPNGIILLSTYEMTNDEYLDFLHYEI